MASSSAPTGASGSESDKSGLSARREAERRDILEKREAAQARRLAETRAKLGRAGDAGPVDMREEIKRAVKAELAERLETTPRRTKTRSSFWGQDDHRI